jgi:hypothetical protein
LTMATTVGLVRKLLDHPLNLRFSPKMLTLVLMSHFFGARLEVDSTRPIKIEAHLEA